MLLTGRRPHTRSPSPPKRQLTPLRRLSFLGSPIHSDVFNDALKNISDVTKKLIARTTDIGSHTALFFLARYASLPRVTYLMRATPVYKASPTLGTTGEVLREDKSRSRNTRLDHDACTDSGLVTGAAWGY